MTRLDITHQRLHNQRLTDGHFATPAEVVQWLGAVQAQDYEGAKWALAPRIDGATEASVEQAIVDGTILRTHILRPTWHFVTPADIRWMLTLTAPRINALSAYYYRQAEQDDATFARANEVIAKALQGGKHLMRSEVAEALQAAGFRTDDLRMTHFMARAELDAVVCNGARRGKQQTYALLDERVPPTPPLTQEEAIAELARRYFVSHGPATLQDYTWWSGLAAADAKAGLEAIKSQLVSETLGEETYWFADVPLVKSPSPSVYLLPNYDEYLVAYTDRSLLFETSHEGKLDSRGNILFNNTIVLDGQVVGTWKRTLKKSSVVISATLFRSLNALEQDAYAQAAQRYGDYLNLSVVAG